jgi:hypothetical protein
MKGYGSERFIETISININSEGKLTGLTVKRRILQTDGDFAKIWP